jgi:selenocysteine lyase/cysteine desulfurase
MAAYLAAVELLLEIGPDVVEKRVLMLSRRLAEGLAERGYELVEPWPCEPHESSGIVSFRRRGALAGEVLRELNAAGVIGRAHADFVRLAPHFYNTQAEVDRVLDVLVPHEMAAASLS